MRRSVIAASLSLVTLLFPRITATADGVRFTSPAAAAIPVDLVGNYVLVQVRVNGSEPLWFLLDSGAATVVSAKCAARLKLATRGSQVGNGVGGAIEATMAANVRLGLPGVEFSEARVVVAPLDGIEASLHRPVDGILGNSVLRRSVVTVDYARKTLRVADPRAYTYGGGGAVVPLVLDRDLVFASATVKTAGHEPVSGLFEIDSGGGHGVILNAPFVRAGKLLDGTSLPRVLVGGLGGAMPAREGRLEWMTLGTARIDAPAALFSEATGGLNASDEFAGNVGADVLRRFVVTFDIPHERMMLDETGAVSP
jgi:aspartyl protease